ncbi:MAG: XdhC family protein, partial [Oscillospiraceae bacterium]|nr:XdhC family protein [Oscillospiraceae bacterium]
MSDMKTLFCEASRELHEGRSLMYVSVVASSGSTPRGAGAMMMVFSDGKSIGTIGGGAVEYAAQKRAVELLELGRSESVGYVLNKSDVANLGMICGGDVTVYFQYLSPEKDGVCRHIDYICAAFDKNDDAWLVRRTENAEVTGMGVYDSEGLHFTDCISLDELKPLLTPNTVLVQGDIGYYIEPLTRTGMVYVFGGGHVAQELVPVIAHLGFRVTVYEDRPEFASKELFPDAEKIVLAGFDKIGENVTITDRDYVVIMTRGHQMDFELLDQTLRTPAYYIGCIGSSKKIAATKEKLAKLGITSENFARVATPIGITIGAKTPAEIAISIAAQ